MSKMSIAATVTGLEVPPKGKNIDVKPYGLGSMVTDRTTKPPVSNSGDGNAGFDVKWGVRQTLVADLTVNTDFAQVEDDQQVVNLSRFSVLFPEKRDFFLEGAETFNFANGSTGTGSTGSGGGTAGSSQNTSTAPLLFYSRRDRIRERLDGPDLGRRSPAWSLGALAVRPAQHADRRVQRRERRVDQFLRRPREPRPLPAEPGRRHVHPPRSGRRCQGWRQRFRQPRVRRRWPDQPDQRHQHRDLRRKNGDRRPKRQGRELSRTIRLDPGQVRDVSGVPVGRHQLQPGNRLPAHAPPSRVRTGRDATVRARDGEAYARSTFSAASTTSPIPSYRPESKETQGNYQMDLDNGDGFSADVSRNYERLTTRFDVGNGVFIPPGEYRMTQSHIDVHARSAAAGVRIDHGGLQRLLRRDADGVHLDGQSRTLPPVLPGADLSWNHVDVPQGIANNNLFSTRGTYTLSPRMFVSALVQYQARTSTVTSNARFRWEYLPGSSSSWSTVTGGRRLNEGFPETQNRSFVVKATRLFRW